MSAPATPPLTLSLEEIERIRVFVENVPSLAEVNLLLSMARRLLDAERDLAAWASIAQVLADRGGSLDALTDGTRCELFIGDVSRDGDDWHEAAREAAVGLGWDPTKAGR